MRVGKGDILYNRLFFVISGFRDSVAMDFFSWRL